jgi:hypothetical protein
MKEKYKEHKNNISSPQPHAAKRLITRENRPFIMV